MDDRATTSRNLTILRRPQVEQRTGLARTTLYQYIKDGDFPAPVPLGPRAVGWLESDVNEWITARVRLGRQGSGSTPDEGAEGRSRRTAGLQARQVTK